MSAIQRQPGGKHFEYFVAKLEDAGARYYSGDDWFCPGHDDGTRGSLGIRELRDGSILMHCMGGCKNKDLMRLAGLNYPADFYPRTRQRYIYRDAAGEPLYCVIRYYKGSDKRLVHKVYQPEHEKADKRGFAAYKQCMEGVERVLYALPKVAHAAKVHDTVFVVGGEKDARAVWEAWRKVGTTNSGGEHAKWVPEYTEALRGVKEVIIVPDRDAAGHTHAATVYDALTGPGGLVPPAVVRIALPAVDGVRGADIANHISDGFGPDDLIPIDREDLSPEVDFKDYSDTDMGNAERLEAQFGRRIRYVHQQKKWLIWDGARWADNDPVVIQMVPEMARLFRAQCQKEIEQAKDSGDEGALKYWYMRKTFALNTENAARIRACLEVARSLPGLATFPSEYDNDPWLFNVLNGTIDLRSGRLRPHDRGALQRKVAPLEYDPSAKCPVFLKFFREVMPSAGVRKFIRNYIGMCLSGVMEDHIFPVFHGHGNNGKSTFIRLMLDLFGDYAQSLPSETLKAKQFGGGIPNDIARLAGARLAMALEFPEATRINEDLLKRLTGGDAITARFLNQEFFDFIPSAKFILATNHKPEFRGTDDGVWRRVRLVPWAIHIPEARVDRKLPEKLREELPGILNWALRGCASWRAEGLCVPPEMEELTQEYREESDIIGMFLEERCVVGPEHSVEATPLYLEFQSFMTDQGMKPWSQTAFGRAIADRAGIERGRTTEKSRRKMYMGLRLPGK